VLEATRRLSAMIVLVLVVLAQQCFNHGQEVRRSNCCPRLVDVLGDRKTAIKVRCGRQPLLPATETGDLYDGIVDLQGSNPDARDAGLRA
jgi:hypothetical protein